MSFLTWLRDLRDTHGSGVPAALGLAVLLALALALAAGLAVQARDQQAELAARADRHAGERTNRLAAQLSQATRVPALILETGLAARDGDSFGASVRSILALTGIVRQLELQPDGRPPLLVGEEGSNAVLGELAPAQLRAVGTPVVSVEGRQMLLMQTVWSGDSPGSRRFWGYLTARVPLQSLADHLDLPALAADGFGVALRFQNDPTAPAIDMFTNGTPGTGGATRTVSLPQGSLLSLAVMPPRTGDALWAWGAAALTGLALLLAYVIGRLSRPTVVAPAKTPVASPVALEAATLEREKLARLQAEEHLERSHAMLDSMLEYFPGMVVIKRAADLRITRINRTGENLLGRSRETLIGRSSHEIYAPDFAERMLETDQQALASGELVELPLERVAMPGQADRWLHYRKLALADRDGRPQYVLEFGIDVSERERLYEEMREQVHFVQQLLEAMPGPLFYKDAEGRYLGVNGAFEAFIGKSREELVGRTVHDVSPPHLAKVYEEADKALLAAGVAQIYESQVTRSDGSTAEVMFHKAVFRSTAGEKGGIVGFALDISERKAAERRVAQLNRILTVLGETSQLIIQIHDRDALLASAGRLLQEKGGFPVAWVNLAGSPPLVFGDGAAAPLVGRLLEIIEQPTRRCWPKARLFCRRLDCCDEDMAAALAGAGLHSMIHLPLEFQGAVRGSIGILGSEAELFDRDEDRLLEELATNLSHALDALAQEEGRRRAEEKLQLAARVFENNAEGIIVTDAANRIVMVNKAFSQVTGYSAEEVIGRNPGMLGSGRQDAEFYGRMWRDLQEQGEWRGEIVNRRKNGEYFPEWLTISMVRNEGGEITNYVAVFSDLTARKKAEERLEFLAHYDPLTTLPNRVLFTERLHQALAQAGRAGQHLALLFLDLDRFKLINETIGHSAGDGLLKEVAQRLRALVGDADGLSRLAGDHFGVFVSGLPGPREAASFARRVQEALKAPLLWEGREIHVSASIGIGVFPDDGRDSETLAKNADSAMYRAIEEGGNRVCFFRQDMNEGSSERVHLEGKLHHALERGEFRLHFQPFIAAASGRVIGAEALLRWSDPELGGLVSPAVFIPLLEETGLIAPVGEWVLRQAVAEAARWRRETGEDVLVAVNLSAEQLADDDLPRKVGQLLAEQELPPACLEIELTESAVMRDAQRGIRLLHEFKALGLHLSIDDFGTGYSSLSYLKQLPINTLKIDRSFVMDTPDDPEAATITRAIIAMGHSLGLHIIAEGVESPAQVSFLREAGADLLQGFRYSPAVPADRFLALLREQPWAGAPAERPARALHLLVR